MLRYLWVDFDSFFASVEQQEQPRLRGQAVGVIPMEAETTCVIAASYEAKRFGVKTGTAVHEARKLCPHINLTLARPDVYVQYHHRIIDAVESCLHVDHISSIDELHGKLMGDEKYPDHAKRIANDVKVKVWSRIGPFVKCSVGIAPSPWLAKVAADLEKPDGLTIIDEHDMPHRLFHLKLDDLPGIAGGMMKRLQRHGVTTIRQLSELSEQRMNQIWASKVWGKVWWHQLRGYDLPYRTTKRRNIGHSHVLPPRMRDDEQARGVMVRMIHKAASRMRRLKYCAGRLDVYIDRLDAPGWSAWLSVSPAARDTNTILHVFSRLWQRKPGGTPYRVGMVLTDLVTDDSASMHLYDWYRNQSALANAMDQIDRKYGRHTVYWGSMFGQTQSAPTRISYTQIPTLDEF